MSERTAANKAAAYWAQRRTDLTLMERSTKCTDLDISALEEELTHILELGNLIYPPTLERIGLEPNLSYSERRARLGLRATEYAPTRHEIDFHHRMKELTTNARQAEWKWRIANHAEEYQALGWYPFFITLTVDPNRHDPEQIWKEGRAFRKYIRSLVNIVCKELGHAPAHKTNTPESCYVTYVGVVEHGKSRQHHHGHFLVWMREIPASWKRCPNAPIGNPQARNRRECLQLRPYWKYSLPGLSKALYFRSIGDIWSRLGFCHPLKDGKPVKIGTPRQSGGYVTKYLGKDHKEWRHRVKATRNLGKHKLLKLMQTLPAGTVEALTWRPLLSSQNHLVKMTHTVPLGLLRRTAKQERFFRDFRERSMDLKTLISKATVGFQRMLGSVRAGVRPERMPLPEFYDWVSAHLPATTGYCDKRLIEAHELLRELFPVDRRTPERVSIGGNVSGYTPSV